MESFTVRLFALQGIDSAFAERKKSQSENFPTQTTLKPLWGISHLVASANRRSESGPGVHGCHIGGLRVIRTSGIISWTQDAKSDWFSAYRTRCDGNPRFRSRAG